MRASEPGSAPEGFPSGPLWLLIGNSRWHWAGLDPEASALSVADPEPGAGAAALPAGLWLRHTPPLSATAPAAPCGASALQSLRAWAAVGPLPAAPALPGHSRLNLADVPLGAMPPWLGIDRALAAWRAWRLLQQPLLVADAGTALSLTRVDGEGAFAGGRLLAGLALQLRAMASGTAALPEPAEPAAIRLPTEAWPRQTDSAMARGVCNGLAAAISEAHAEAAREASACRLVLTGGDAALLLPLLRLEGARVLHRPALVLEAMVALRPA